MIPLDRGNRADPYTEPNSCFSDSSNSLNSLNSLNSMKVPLHLEKTAMKLIYWKNSLLFLILIFGKQDKYIMDFFTIRSNLHLSLNAHRGFKSFFLVK